jgi:nucleoid DNA-binding protein
MTYEHPAFELYGDGPIDSFLARMRSALAARGFLEGASPRTPRNILLVPRARPRAASIDVFDHLGSGGPTFVQGLREPGVFGVRDGEDLGEWVDGEERIVLSGPGNGHYGALDWEEVAQGSGDLPAEVVAPLAANDASAFAAALLDHRYGPRGEAEEGITFHRSFAAVDDAATEAWLADAIARAWSSGRAALGGLGTIERRGDAHLQARASAGLNDWANGKGKLPLEDLPEAVHACLSGALAALLADQDVVFGRSLLVGSVVHPGYEGRNPRTGAVIPVPPRRAPYFLFFPRT